MEMVQIEYDKIKIEVPENWNEITLGHWETFCTESPETAREHVAWVAKVCKVEAELLLNWPAEVFNSAVTYLEFLFRDNPVEPCPGVEVGGIKYAIPIEDELSLGAWIDADQVQKQGENVLSNILAIVCRPVGEAYDCGNNETRQAMFAALPVSAVSGLLAFFLHCKTVLERRTAAYTKLGQAIDQLPQNIKPFLKPGGGTRLSNIWLTVKYTCTIQLLRYRWRRHLLNYNLKRTRITRIRHNAG